MWGIVGKVLSIHTYNFYMKHFLLNQIFTRVKFKNKYLLKRNLPTPVGSADRNFFNIIYYKWFNYCLRAVGYFRPTYNLERLRFLFDFWNILRFAGTTVSCGGMLFFLFLLTLPSLIPRVGFDRSQDGLPSPDSPDESAWSTVVFISGSNVFLWTCNVFLGGIGLRSRGCSVFFFGDEES